MKLSTVRLEVRGFLLGQRTDPGLSRRVESLLSPGMDADRVKDVLWDAFGNNFSMVSFPETDERGDASVVCAAFMDFPPE
jgi:hypothetical protein